MLDHVHLNFSALQTHSLRIVTQPFPNIVAPA